MGAIFFLAHGLFLSLSCYIFIFLPDFHTRDNELASLPWQLFPYCAHLTRPALRRLLRALLWSSSLLFSCSLTLPRAQVSSHLSHGFIILGTRLSLSGKGIQDAKLMCTVFDTMSSSPPYSSHLCACLSVCLPACLSVSVPRMSQNAFYQSWISYSLGWVGIKPLYFNGFPGASWRPPACR